MHLKPGDVVMLKSGGHPVTVAEVNEDSVECLWMGDSVRETFPIAVLERMGIDDSDDGEEEQEDDDEYDADEDDVEQDDADEDDVEEDDDEKDKVA